MGVLDALIGVALGGPEYDSFECRRCGRSLGTSQPSCPECGSTEIATIEID